MKFQSALIGTWITASGFRLQYPTKLASCQEDCHFGKSGDPERLYRDNGMDVASIVAKAKALVAKK